MAHDDDAVLVTEPASGIRLVTLNLPHVRNAMTAGMTAAWAAAMRGLEEDRGVRVAVVTGAGSSFCAGADLSWLDQGADDESTTDRLRDRMLPFYRSWLAPRSLPFPVIAAVNGPAVGAGVCMALACDLRYAGPAAVFSTPFLHLGTHSGMGATWLLPEAIGLSRAREMLYTGREVHSEESRQWGLVSSVEDDVVASCLEVAGQIAAGAPIATRLTKTGLEHAEAGLEASLRWEALAQPVTMTTADIHEGIAARRHHRTPRFRDR